MPERPWWANESEAPDILAIPDETIDTLAPDAREEVARVWQRRSGLELRVAAGFSAVATEMFEHGAPSAVVKIVGKAVRDEIRHSEICVDLAARYRGGDPQWPGPVPVHTPEFAPTKGRLKLALHMIAMCCINETIACSTLEASISQAKSPLVRAALRSILSDEVDHARAGWAHIASPWVTEAMKQEMPEWLRRMHAAKLHELLEEVTPLPGESFPDHGFLSRAQSRAIVHASLVEVIFPGFDRADIDTALVREWATSAFQANDS